MKKRLFAKISIFVTQRLLVIQGHELVDNYTLAHLIVKTVVVLLQWTLAIVVFLFSYPFPWQLHCPLSEELKIDTELEVRWRIF